MKHYHVTAGLQGGYLPNSERLYSTKGAAISAARDIVAEYRDSGEKVRGGTFPASEAGRIHGRWVARESESLPGTFWDVIYVTGPCRDECEEED